MEYSISTNGNQAEVTIEGKLTFEKHADFRQLIKELGKLDIQKQIVDLNAVEFIDSAGLGLLLRMNDASKKSGRNFALRIPADGQVNKMLTVARFDELVSFA